MATTVSVFSEVKAATPEVQERADKVRRDVETKLGKSFKNFTVTKYVDQAADGLNYKMKVKVDDDAYRFIHIALNEASASDKDGAVTLLSVDEGKTCCNPL